MRPYVMRLIFGVVISTIMTGSGFPPNMADAASQDIANTQHQRDIYEQDRDKAQPENIINDELIYILDKKNLTPIDLIKTDQNSTQDEPEIIDDED